MEVEIQQANIILKLIKMKKLLLLVAIALFISCGGEQKKSESTNDDISVIGFWERIGTIQIVKGVKVDTIFFKDLADGDDVIPRQIKAYSNGHFAWLNNQKINQQTKDDYKEVENFPWVSGAGGFGTFSFSEEGEINMNENMTNIIGNIVGWNNEFRDNVRKNGVNNLTFSSNVDNNKYTQLMQLESEENSVETWQTGIEYAEYFEKIPDGEETKIDGVWKHIADVRYVNGVPIDTTAVPEGLDDHKIFHKGNVIVNWDPTTAKAGDNIWGGAGLAGIYEYNTDKEELMEKFTLGTGNWMPKGSVWPNSYYDIDWIDDDTFIQVFRTRAVPSEDGSGLVWEEVGEESNGHLNVRVK